jgi:hypothetical protein
VHLISSERGRGLGGGARTPPERAS